MQIEAGKYYRTRGGQVFGPMIRDEDPGTNYPWCLVSSEPETCWAENGQWVVDKRNRPFDLVAEVYVSDTPPADTPATPSDDTIISFNFSELARESKKWMSGSIGFWIGDEMRTAHYDVRIGGVEGKVWPSDVPNPWRDKPPAPQVNTTKTARDELVEKAALEIFKRFYLTPEGQVGFDWMWRAAENFVEARKK